MVGDVPGRDPVEPAVELALPFTGRWVARNSPARRIPSHGSDLFGERYAVDFVAVDERGRTAGIRDAGTLFGTEPPDRFFAFGQPILAPAGGVVVASHDGEPDHPARRSQLSLVGYMLGQAGRVRRGVEAIAGNYLVMALPDRTAFVALVHLRAGTLRVAAGETVVQGQQLATCGNSGNSTQPHLHIQAMDSADLSVARGVPMTFRSFREWPRGATNARFREWGMPGEASVIEPLAS